MLTPWHKGRDQNNVAGLSYSSHAFILPTSADSLIVISVWADTHLAHTEFGDCCYSPRKTFSERKRWKTRTHLLGFSIFPLPCSLATINTPEETRQLIELPLCCHTSGKESKQSCKSKRSKRFKAWHFFLKALRRGCLHESLDAVRAQKKKALERLRRQNLSCCQCPTDPTLPPSQSIHLTELDVYRGEENHNIRSAPGADRG